MVTDFRAHATPAETGWQAAELHYVGNELAMTLILPDPQALQPLKLGIDGNQLLG